MDTWISPSAPLNLGTAQIPQGREALGKRRGIQSKPPPSPSTQDPFPRWRVGLDKDLLVETHTPPGCRQLSETGRQALVSATAGQGAGEPQGSWWRQMSSRQQVGDPLISLKSFG